MAHDDGLDCLIGTAMTEGDAQWVRVVLIEDRETMAAVRPIAGAGNWGIFVQEPTPDQLAPLMYYTAGALAAVARVRGNTPARK